MRTFFLAVILLVILNLLPAQQTTASAPGDLAKAHELLNQGHPDQAIAILKKLATVEPPIKGVEHELGTAYYSISELPAAKDAFAKAIKQDTSDLDSVQMEGLVLYRLGQPEAAIPYLERAVQGAPDASGDAQTVLGLCFVAVKRFDDARVTYAKLFDVPPESAAAYLLLATMLRHMQLSELAATQAQKALDISPNVPLAHFMLGEIALDKSDFDQAARQFEAERRINPDYALGYERLGDAYMHLDKLPEAQMALTKAITLDTDLTSAFVKMGMVLLRRQDPQTAIQYLQHAEQLNPDDFETHSFLAQAYHKIGQEGDAKRENAIADKIQHDSQMVLQTGK
ncbi:MAG: tetratricopeptide repeat protein [Terracidiphilus sp.]|jgi:tetratricopeptide (TPR) repeat protein